MEIKIDVEGESIRPNSHRKNLRVLHIGNIANNAYLNAKILNEAGVDCDVMCHSYYHIMGNPEREDADFTGDTGSEFFPKWNNVNLGNFRRPHWFAQGPMNACVRYLINRRRKNIRRERIYWLLLEISRSMAKYPRLTYFFSNLAYFFSKLTYLGEFAFSIFIRIPLKLGIKLWRILMGQLRRMLGYTSRDPNMPKGLPSTVSDPKSTQPASDVSFAHPLYQRFASTFLQAFPQRSDQLLPQDIEPYLGTIEMLHTLFKEYDIIHAYATDTIFAMLSGTHPYIAYEHGTIRSIPFEESAQGRLTALSYHMADGVIVTNCDNKRAAEKLNLADYRFIPHPINEKWMQPGIGQSLRQDLRNELNSDFVIFHPARQHWDDRREPSWEKGNDILIEGLARTIHQTGMNLCAVFVEWGQTIRQSKALISKLGIEKNIKWVPPMHSANMARYIDACDLLADQFFLGAFGSTMPRALALGKPAMIYIDEDIHRWCFPEMPPVINARTPDQIYHGLKRALADPAWLAGLAQNGQKWYQKYHSNEIIGKRLISFYEDVLKNHPSPEYLEKVDMGGQKG